MVVLQQEFIPGLSYSPELDNHPSTVISYHGPFFQQSPTYPGVFERSVQCGIYTSLQNKANSSPSSRASRQSIKRCWVCKRRTRRSMQAHLAHGLLSHCSEQLGIWCRPLKSNTPWSVSIIIEKQAGLSLGRIAMQCYMHTLWCMDPCSQTLDMKCM